MKKEEEEEEEEKGGRNKKEGGGKRDFLIESFNERKGRLRSTTFFFKPEKSRVKVLKIPPHASSSKQQCRRE